MVTSALEPKPSPPATSVDAAILSRRSAAGFEHDPIELESLAFVLERRAGTRGCGVRPTSSSTSPRTGSPASSPVSTATKPALIA
jgi:hypothetical protein